MYKVNEKAKSVNSSFGDAKVDLSGIRKFEDVITLDDKPLNLGPLITKLENIVSEAVNSLQDTNDVGDGN